LQFGISSEQNSERLWIASDSRLSDEGGSLIDEGVKIFELPVICRGPSERSGEFTEVYYVNTVGLACSGHSLIYHQIQANLTPLLGNSIGMQCNVPSISDIANFTAAIGTQYVRSLGRRRPHTASRVPLLIAGWCPIQRALIAYEMHPQVEAGWIEFVVTEIDLSTPYFAGDRLDWAHELYREISGASVAEAPGTRAPLNVLRRMIDDPEAPTVGGDVQVGFTVGPAFRRVRTLRPIPGTEPKVAFWLNAICTDDLPRAGPCELGLMGSISP
jgi:hypothetical protein